ncbi:hypothetical protein D9757_010195 [Collybiopsis confluens]|uniref:Uncharacterized protein n=1 Tax=Collybiopsis confluens TaxID=2823264 RepID=A0A8H5GPL1_9AGAR|nr:hypothetical protein D9757_010195 [Collybiopsis confluens]
MNHDHENASMTGRNSPHTLARPNYALLKTVSSKNSGALHPYSDVHDSLHADDDTTSSIGSSPQAGYIGISVLFLLAVVIACMNHVLFVHLNEKEPGSHASQFWVTALKNMFPAAVSFLLFMNLRNCLYQIALHRIRLGSHSLELANLITSPPSLLNTLSVLFKSSMQISIMSFALLTTIVQAVALTSLFIPGTLGVVPASPHIQTLLVPGIDFNAVDPAQCAEYDVVQAYIGDTIDPEMMFQVLGPSQKWRLRVLRAASDNVAPAWDPPVGCGSACSYSFPYFAPALNCTQLSRQDIWPSAPDANDSRLTVMPLSMIPATNGSIQGWIGKAGFYNSTTGSGNYPGPYTTLDIIYMANFDSINFQYAQPEEWSPRGVHCTFYNATYEARATFSNNTQSTNTRVLERHNPLAPFFNMVDTESPSTRNMTMAFDSIVMSFSDILLGQAYSGEQGTPIQISTQAFYTPLFNITTYRPTNNISLTEDGGIVTTFSLSSTLGEDLSIGLQDLLGNISLAFVNEQMVTTNVEAMVTPNATQYQYISWRLGLIYGIVFGFSLAVIAYGIFCLHKNGTVAVFDLQHILEMTAMSTRLHECAAQPEFSSILVRGVFSTESNGKRQRKVLLEVCDS